MKKLLAVILIFILSISNVYGAQKVSAYSIKINAASQTLRLYYDSALVKEYPVAVGKPTTKTPIGEFVIRNKAKNPVWHNKGNPVAPGPKNPLGIRWMGINAPNGTYGIHGNSVPASIQTYASGGCIRMFNNDVAELYDIVGVATPVEIVYENIELKQDKYNNTVAFVIYPDAYKLKNAESTMNKLASRYPELKITQKERVLKLAASNISKPIAISEGTAIMLNNQYLTSDAFIEENQVFLYFEAGLEHLGIDGAAMSAYNLSVKEREGKVYINLTEAIAKLGGQLSVDEATNNVYVSISIVKVNGTYLQGYKGTFDKQYNLEAGVLNGIGNYYAADDKQALSIKEFCEQQGWGLYTDSLNKMLDIQVPLRIKIADAYFNAVSYNGRYYINSADAFLIEEIQNQDLQVYNYKDKTYYDVYEIMEKYEYNQDDHFTILEVMKLKKSQV